MEIVRLLLSLFLFAGHIGAYSIGGAGGLSPSGLQLGSVVSRNDNTDAELMNDPDFSEARFARDGYYHGAEFFRFGKSTKLWQVAHGTWFHIPIDQWNDTIHVKSSVMPPTEHLNERDLQTREAQALFPNFRTITNCLYVFAEQTGYSLNLMFGAAMPAIRNGCVAVQGAICSTPQGFVNILKDITVEKAFKFTGTTGVNFVVAYGAAAIIASKNTMTTQQTVMFAQAATKDGTIESLFASATASCVEGFPGSGSMQCTVSNGTFNFVFAAQLTKGAQDGAKTPLVPGECGITKST